MVNTLSIICALARYGGEPYSVSGNHLPSDCFLKNTWYPSLCIPPTQPRVAEFLPLPQCVRFACPTAPTSRGDFNIQGAGTSAAEIALTSRGVKEMNDMVGLLIN